jgi:hypothetical protein
VFAEGATGYVTPVRDDLEAELSDRLVALEGWPVPRDPEPLVWADAEDDEAGAIRAAGNEGSRPAGERS